MLKNNEKCFADKATWTEMTREIFPAVSSPDGLGGGGGGGRMCMYS